MNARQVYDSQKNKGGIIKQSAFYARESLFQSFRHLVMQAFVRVMEAMGEKGDGKTYWTTGITNRRNNE